MTILVIQSKDIPVILFVTYIPNVNLFHRYTPISLKKHESVFLTNENFDDSEMIDKYLEQSQRMPVIHNTRSITVLDNLTLQQH